LYKEATLMRELKGEAAQCRVCEHYCALKPGEWGKCGVRVNREGRVYLAVYGLPVAAHIDPIEKKPLFHFLPGSRALSIGTYGCNMRCQWCQNWSISQVREVKDLEQDPATQSLSPEKLVNIALRQGIQSIAYTYNEPTVFFEYTYDTAQLAHEHDIKNVYVSNGYMTEEALERIEPYLDGINVDLKGFDEVLYEDYAGARLAPVKRNIKSIALETDIWIEVTTLVVPNLNDSDDELRAVAEWLVSVNPDIPWHLSAFHPSYQMLDRSRTPRATLERAYEIGKEAGLNYIYLGNVLDPERESTQCSECGELLIQRHGYRPRPRWREPGICDACETRIPGVWGE
jgi:pyruvate formate lyase activating enzyme